MLGVRLPKEAETAVKNLVDTTPKASFLRGLQNQRWTVSGAISELVDNSYGFGRGDARTVWIKWDANRRVLSVIDDGKGMDAISRLFRLGDTIGRAPGDIGEYGSGGTMALLWLSKIVNVWTVRDGRTASATVNWGRQIAEGTFPQIDDAWYLTTERNTPAELRRIGRGTMIELYLPDKRKVHVSNVQKDLGRTYGAALRSGRQLLWRSHGRGSAGDELKLQDAIEFVDSRRLEFALEIDGKVLTASGRIGFKPGLKITDYGIAICFGPRLLTVTKDCFSSEDGRQRFAGIGLLGYVDLDDGWQPLLSTTKTAIDDDRAWELLMKTLFDELRPDLERLEREQQRMQFDGLRLELQDVTERALQRRRADDGELRPNETGPDVMGILRSGTQKTEHNAPSGRAEKTERAATSVELQMADDDALHGTLCHVEVDGRNRFSVFVNQEHRWIKEALSAESPTRRALQTAVVYSIAMSIAENPGVLRLIFSKDLVDQISAKPDGKTRGGYVARLLADRVLQ